MGVHYSIFVSKFVVDVWGGLGGRETSGGTFCASLVLVLREQADFIILQPIISERLFRLTQKLTHAISAHIHEL